jgi:hypothetical protein
MVYDLSASLVYATALAVFGMMIVWGLPMGALSISRSISAYRARRARHARRTAFHRRLRVQRRGASGRPVVDPRLSRQGV